MSNSGSRRLVNLAPIVPYWLRESRNIRLTTRFAASVTLLELKQLVVWLKILPPRKLLVPFIGYSR